MFCQKFFLGKKNCLKKTWAENCFGREKIVNEKILFSRWWWLRQVAVNANEDNATLGSSYRMDGPSVAKTVVLIFY